MKTRPIKTKLLTALLTLCMVLSLVPISALAADSTVSNETELKTALENADCTEIKLGGNIETSWQLDVERTVTLDLNGYTLSCSGTDEDIIRVRSSGNLTVKDSGTGGKIDGQNKNCGFNVKGGTLTLESGSIVNCMDDDGDGGAVDVSNTGVTETPTKYGKFIMNGGAITDCKAGDDGGAVDIGSGCTFIMNGGTISGCRADDDGGAVFIKQSGTFELNGGVIQNCSAGANGGAVNIYEDGRFTMTGGVIKDCKVDLGGYGIAVYGKDDKAIVAISGGTIENCGVKPWHFDAYTVTFDSDGGSAVTEQKLLNSPAVKPADPKKDGYDFAGWYLGDTQYAFDTKVTENITLKAHWTSASASSSITSVNIENVKLDYQPDTAPQASAKRTGANQDNYDILFECWEKREKDANDTVSTVAYWYSDESGYSDGDARFNTFEKGGRYRYSVKLQVKDGYTFDSNLKDENVTLNGASLPSGSWVMVMDDGKTCLIQYGTELRPGQTVEEIRLDGAVINFTAGDKPRFSGVVDPYIDIDHQRWDANDGSGYGITSSDFWNTRYNGKLITEFEAGKSYTYGVYFKISDLGMEEGYRFDKSTKLYINGKEIALTSDQISLDDNGETIWFYNVLTMTPESGGTTPSEKCTVTYTDGVDGEEIFKDQIYTVEAGKATPAFSGTPTRDGYKFTGWSPKVAETVTGNVTYTAQWEKQTPAEAFTVTYTDGVDNEEIFKDQTYTVESGKATPAFNGTPTRDGYKFTGWSPKVAETVTGNVTYTAQWEKQTPAEAFTVTYTDGVDNEEIFKDQTYTVESGKATPAFNGTPTRKGYTFTGWKPAVAATVTGNVTYEATWKVNSTTPSENKPNTGETTSPKTGDTSNMVLWAALLFVSCGALAGTVVIGRKKKTMK